MLPIAQAALILVAIFLCLLVCSVLRVRPRRRRMFTPAEIDELRIRKELEKEALLEDRIEKLQARKRLHAHNRYLLTARKDTSLLLEAGEDKWDARGRQIYGDAWDVAEDGKVPLKEIFQLPEDELRNIRIEAANRIAMESARTYRQQQQQQKQGPNDDGMMVQEPGLAHPRPPPLPPGVAGQSGQNYEGANGHHTGGYDAGGPMYTDGALKTARAGRSGQSKPLMDTPYIDPRFINAYPGQQIKDTNSTRRSSIVSDSPFIDPRFSSAVGTGAVKATAGTGMTGSLLSDNEADSDDEKDDGPGRLPAPPARPS